MYNLSNYFFAGFNCADDIAIFDNEHDRDSWVTGVNANNNAIDPIAAEDRVALTLNDVRIAFMPGEGAPSADEQIIAAIEEATPDDVDDRIRWITF